MKKEAFTIFTFRRNRRKGRNHNALQRKYWNGVGKPFTYAYKRKAYKKARGRRAEQRAKAEWGID